MKHFCFSLLASLIIIVLYACNNATSELEKYSNSIKEQKLDTVIVETYPDGQIKSAIYYLENDNERTQKIAEEHFYSDGVKQAEGTFKNGERYGRWVFYHENGRVWSTGHFENGLSQGIFDIYKPDGTIYIKSYYTDGKKTKEEYYKNGKVDQTVDLRDSKKAK
ncbi:MAG: hypothetical protein JXR60_02535 [Bacteroidales bacterium]|nr:hypothetical protein [Bacteroidales bacterium]